VLKKVKRGKDMNAAAIIMPKTARFLFGPPPPPSEPSSSSSTTTILGSMDQIFDLPSYEVVLFVWDFVILLDSGRDNQYGVG
jgi:hypothetical protein